MIINVVVDNCFGMSDIEEKDDYENHESTDHAPNWTNLVCPSCAIYYGVQSLISSIKKRKRKNRRNIIVQNN
jgi:hypothetical protein